MQKFFTRSLVPVIVMLVFAVFAPVYGQVNVTFSVNTSTNLDTLTSAGFVQLRGALNGGAPGAFPDGNAIDWSATGSTLGLTNVGGDEWEITFQMNSDDTLNFKVWAGFDSTAGTEPDGGWEGGFNGSNGIDTDTRTFISGAADTTVRIYYHPNTGVKVDQGFQPFESKADTITICFRVNMAGITEAQAFDPAIHDSVGIRGDNTTSGGVFDWGATKILLTRETNGVKDDPFWSGYAYVPKDSVTAGSVQNYKFYMENNSRNDGWEGIANNRNFSYTETLIARCDTTIQWVYFEDRAPTGKVLVDANVTFRVSTEALEGLGLFDRGVGDEIKTIGPNGWDVTVGQATSFIDMNFIAALNEWTAAEPFSKFPDDQIAYKFFVRWHESRADTNSPNYIPNLKIRGLNDEGTNEDSGWEEPAVTGGGNRIHTYTSSASQETTGDFGFPKAFFNSVPGNGVITDDITIGFNVDMAAAKDAAQNTLPLFDASKDSVWIQWDGSLLALTLGFETFGSRDLLLSDTDGDMTYSLDFNVPGPSWYQYGFVVVYGNATDGYQQNGGGSIAAGRRYYEYVQPDNVDGQLNTTWPAGFDFMTIWQEKDLPLADPPNLTVPTSVESSDGFVPQEFALAQNYPNPFNPETNIKYNVPAASRVKIEVYNLMGQLVNTLVDEELQAGNYTVKWLGNDRHNRQVSSGLYLLKMKAGDFTKVRKMALVR